MNKPDVDRLIVVCGVGRSGTSLLQSMLNAHPKICFPPETHFFRQYVACAWRNWRFRRKGPAAFRDVLNHDRYFARLGLDVEEVLSPYMKGERRFDMADVYRRILNMYATREKCPRVGDKDPRIIDYTEEIGALFPNAVLIHVVRDPRDVLLSRMKAKWSSARPWWLHVLVSQAQLSIGRHIGQRVFRDRYVEIRYEDLIQYPEKTLRMLCHYIGVPFDKRMLEFSVSASRLVSKDELQWKSETLGPLLSDNVEKWREGLSSWRIRFTEEFCREALSDFGYPHAAEGTQINLLQRAVLLVVKPIRLVFTELYRLWLLIG